MSSFFLGGAVALAGLAGPGSASPPTDERPPKVVSVERGPFTVTLDREGVFVERDPVVVTYRPEVRIGVAEVIEAVAPGPVERDQVLVRLRNDLLDERIQTAELDLASAWNRLTRLREKTHRADEAMELQLLQADLQVADAERELHARRTIDAPEQLRRSQDGVRDWDVVRAEQEEQFQILVRMYQADDLLETNERLDIERARRQLDRGSTAGPRVIARHEILAKITIPRQLAALEFGLRQARHARDLLRASSSLRVEQSRLELAKSELALTNQERALEKLRRDRDALTITAPIDGHAIAGHYRDRWQGLDAAQRRPRPDSRVSPEEVLFTIVQPAPKWVRTSIPEEMLFEVHEEQEATLRPTAVSGLTLPATVTGIAHYSADGQFVVWLRARIRHERLYPGATCRVRLVVRDNPEALTVPAKAIRRVDGVDLVEVWNGTEATARPVEVGLTSGDRTEILAGLEAGEEVVLDEADEK